ncbi:MAG: AraC family transcriptional regulator [Defluviitaleaceae bacterium]|nr:AraC family transcriptional regulator [Defluviitaleaceae bacterium]MCL2835626.1 AraC family transcriptional regulator [Defluviitaleaceae bacterium]
MHAWESIQKTLDYIEDNIKAEISIEELADIAALSLFYYQRLFARLVKKPVREYIKLRRLARAGKSLEDKNRRVLDIALEYGFNCHETFTRAFKDAYGFSPSEYRDNPVPLNNFNKPDLLLGYVMIDEGVPLISEGIVLEINRRVLEEPIDFLGIVGHINIDGQIPAGEVTGVDEPGAVWTRFHGEKHRINRKPEGREFGMSFMGDAPEGCFSYFAGAEVEPGADHGGFHPWRLPAREYIVCGFEAEDFEKLVTDTLYKAMNYSYAWIEKHGLEIDFFSAEFYYKNPADTAYMELWYPVSAAKRT